MLRPEGRTPVEVTAAAERTADLALKCARLTRERDEALAAVERVRVLADESERRDWRTHAPGMVRVAELRAALGERP